LLHINVQQLQLLERNLSGREWRQTRTANKSIGKKCQVRSMQMNKAKSMMVAAIFTAALILPALPVMADRDGHRENPGLHKGWEKKHHGWEKKHDKKWHGKHDDGDDRYRHRRRADHRRRDWRDGHDRKFTRADKREIRKDLKDVREARSNVREDRSQLRKDYQELRSDRAELRKDIRNGASRAEIAQGRQEIREDMKKIADGKKELKQSQGQLKQARRELRQDFNKK
jgi:hypothetical protein